MRFPRISSLPPRLSRLPTGAAILMAAAHSVTTAHSHPLQINHPVKIATVHCCVELVSRAIEILEDQKFDILKVLILTLQLSIDFLVAVPPMIHHPRHLTLPMLSLFLSSSHHTALDAHHSMLTLASSPLTPFSIHHNGKALLLSAPKLIQVVISLEYATE